MKTTEAPPDLPGESWRSIPTAPGYEASSLGRIRNAARMRPLSLNSNPQTGYLQFTTSSDGRRKTHTVHRAVCAAFHGNPPSPKHQAAHGNGDRADNRAVNLRWATRSENMRDSMRHGTWNRVPFTRSRTVSPRPPKLSEGQAREIRALRGQMGQTEVGRRYGVSRGAVESIWSGRSWRHLDAEGGAA